MPVQEQPGRHAGKGITQTWEGEPGASAGSPSKEAKICTRSWKRKALAS